MPTHFQSYVHNFNRVRFSELIDYYALQARIERARPSLIANPLTGILYNTDVQPLIAAAEGFTSGAARDDAREFPSSSDPTVF